VCSWKRWRPGEVTVHLRLKPILADYIALRPKTETPALFLTIYCRRWDKSSVSKLFIGLKSKAGITKIGSVHVFGRHRAATLMVKRGVSLNEHISKLFIPPLIISIEGDSMKFSDLTEDQWEHIECFLPPQPRVGRKRAEDRIRNWNR